MKDKIFTFLIGLLIGAILTASGFLIYEKVNSNKIQMLDGERREMMEMSDGQTPPDMNNERQNEDFKNNKQEKNTRNSKKNMNDKVKDNKTDNKNIVKTN